MRGAKRRALVEVFWRDAAQHFDLKSLNDLPDDYIVKTLGYVLEDGERFFVIAQEILPRSDGYRGVAVIPQEMVVSIRYLAPTVAIPPQ